MSKLLPAGYEHHEKKSRYIKPSQLAEGDHKYHIMQEPVCGFMEWKEKKPFRYKSGNQPKESYDEKNPIHEFWSLYVWCYKQNGLYILDIKQRGLIQGLISLGKDEEWDDSMEYDIKIIKKGSGSMARYSITRIPIKTVAPQILEAFKSDPCNLQALFEGKDPWTGKTSEKAHGEGFDAFSEDPMQKLEEALELQGVDVAYLPAFIGELAAKKGKTLKEVAVSALLPNWLNAFKDQYLKWQASYKTAELPF